MNRRENIHLLKAVIWSQNSTLSIDRSFRDKQSWSVSVKENFSTLNNNDKNTIKGTSMSEIIDKFQFDEISLLKMDIEGAERFLFTEEIARTFLQKVKFLSFEIHDEFNCRPDIEEYSKIIISNTFSKVN